MNLRSAVLYNIFIDRFSRGTERDRSEWVCDEKQYCGGTLDGIIERLDYLKDLGVTVLLLTPFNTGVAYHGYHTTDFFSVDARFGSLDSFKKLLYEAHARNMKVIMDWVINHVSEEHPFFLEAKAHTESEYRNWFYFKKDSDTYTCFLNITMLPKLNLGHEPARHYIFEATRFWLRLGVDGLRLDHVVGIPHGFWAEFRKTIKHEFPHVILIGEAIQLEIKWRDLHTLRIKHKYLAYALSLLKIYPREILIRQYVPHFDAMLDFGFRDLLVKWLAYSKRPHVWIAEFLIRLRYSFYPKNFQLIALLENHDHARFIYECRGDWQKYKMAVALQMKQDKPVCVYYGAEAGLLQEYPKTDDLYGDADLRRPMPWGHFNNDIFDFYKKQIRQRHRRLRHR